MGNGRISLTLLRAFLFIDDLSNGTTFKPDPTPMESNFKVQKTATELLSISDVDLISCNI